MLRSGNAHVYAPIPILSNGSQSHVKPPQVTDET